MNKAVVTFQIIDDFINIKNMYINIFKEDIPIETMEFPNSLFSKVDLVGIKMYDEKYDIDIYGVKMIKNSNISITKELEDFICSVVNNSKFIKENNIKAYKLVICVNIDHIRIIEIDNYIKNNYNLSNSCSYSIFNMKLKSNEEFIVGDD